MPVAFAWAARRYRKKMPRADYEPFMVGDLCRMVRNAQPLPAEKPDWLPEQDSNLRQVD